MLDKARLAGMLIFALVPLCLPLAITPLLFRRVEVCGWRFPCCGGRGRRWMTGEIGASQADNSAGRAAAAGVALRHRLSGLSIGMFESGLLVALLSLTLWQVCTICSTI